MIPRRTRTQAAAPETPPGRPLRPVRGGAAAIGAPVSSRATATRSSSARSAPRPVAPFAPLEVFPPRATALRDPFFARLADVMQDLFRILNEESDALDDARPEHLDALRERKDGLTTIYLECLVTLRKDESLRTRLDPADRDALKAAGERLREVSVTNMRRLQARINTVNGVVGALMEAARTVQGEELKVYEADGKIGSTAPLTARLGVDTNL